RRRRARPRSSSPSSATARPAPSASRSCASSRASRTCPTAENRRVIRSTVADVDLGAVAHNLRQIRALLDRESRAIPDRASAAPPGIIAVVKANAYGHGAGPVALTLEEAGATMLACADIEEGIALRRAGVEAEILIFGALGISDVSGLFEYRLTPTISTPSAGRALQEAAAARGVRLRCHLKIDTGMNRLGFRHDNLA